MRRYLDISENLNDSYLLIRDITDSGIRKNCCLLFNHLADEQRGKPEFMGGACMANPNLFPNGTGLYTFCTEHVGDLTNRMAAHWATGNEGEGEFGFEFVEEKVARMLRYARSGYGFEREMREQIQSNWQIYVKDGRTTSTLQEWWTDLEEAGIRYADAHNELTVYNDAQWTARQAAIDLGKMNFGAYKERLEVLESNLGSSDDWIAYASRVRIDSSGKPAPFGN
jgi:hypothetical protein